MRLRRRRPGPDVAALLPRARAGDVAALALLRTAPSADALERLAVLLDLPAGADALGVVAAARQQPDRAAPLRRVLREDGLSEAAVTELLGPPDPQARTPQPLACRGRLLVVRRARLTAAEEAAGHAHAEGCAACRAAAEG